MTGCWDYSTFSLSKVNWKLVWDRLCKYGKEASTTTVSVTRHWRRQRALNILDKKEIYRENDIDANPEKWRKRNGYWRYIRAQVALLFPKNLILPTRSLIFKAHLGSWNCWSLLFFQMFVFFLDTSCMNFDLVRPDRCLKDNADINCQEQNGTLANNLNEGERTQLKDWSTFINIYRSEGGGKGGRVTPGFLWSPDKIYL